MWITNPPEDILPLDPSLVRIDTYFGVNKIGKMDNWPEPKSDNEPENRGVYLHVLT